ncbi:hypothetical protein FACS189415_4220 [Bacteroidia bacterium]|nr:hypothetical protein FACS189415_4220 [Bacteroidia bacterium]
MENIDRIVFGDNQFFGINHMSQEKSQQLAEKFYDINSIYRVYDIAIEAGIDAIMLNSNQRAEEICTHFRQNQQKYGHLKWYPSIPYPHKYANIVAEKGIFPAFNEILFSNNTASGVLGMITKGASAVLFKDAIKILHMLVDIEMKMFNGLNVKVVFLQNVITDLLLGYDIKLIFEEYCNYIRKKYNVLPGFITLNLPHLVNKLNEWNIHDVVICSSINKIGFTMCPGIEAYEKTIRENDIEKIQIMAMSTLASGAIPPKEAYEYVKSQNIQSIVFGASSKKNIEESTQLILS